MNGNNNKNQMTKLLWTNIVLKDQEDFPQMRIYYLHS